MSTLITTVFVSGRAIRVVAVIVVVVVAVVVLVLVICGAVITVRGCSI